MFVSRRERKEVTSVPVLARETANSPSLILTSNLASIIPPHGVRSTALASASNKHTLKIRDLLQTGKQRGAKVRMILPRAIITSCSTSACLRQVPTGLPALLVSTIRLLGLVLVRKNTRVQVEVSLHRASKVAIYCHCLFETGQSSWHHRLLLS